MTEPQAGGTYAQLRDLARWAEVAGFDVFSRSDHYLDGGRSAASTDVLTSLAGLGRDTTSIKLNVLVTPASFRHPANLAKTAATVDEISEGRLELGVGTGWMESEHSAFGLPFPDWPERFDRLEETLGFLHAAFGRAAGGFNGARYRLSDIEVLPRPTGELPIIVGGEGPRRTPMLAGEFADELNVFTRPVNELVARWDVMRTAASEHGRDPDSIKLSITDSPIVGEDRADYRERLRERAAAAGQDADEFERLSRSRNHLRGTVDEVGTRLAGLAAAGVARLYIQVYAPLNEIDTNEVGRVLQLLKD